ncbi:hypothetical protein, partial [Prevotella sp.]|uniref:hypothetical protein n=1 Tax=Prevotella sp. TaxID=59823 RepID=UPI004026A506
AVWSIAGTTMRMRMAVCRMRMRITMLRMRIRMSARVWKSKYIGVQRWGRAPRCGAEGNEPQQQRP